MPQSPDLGIVRELECLGGASMSANPRPDAEPADNEERYGNKPDYEPKHRIREARDDEH